jgi:hypothetical protein
VRLDDAGFSFRHVDGDECLAAFMSITSNAIDSDGISLKLLKLLLPFIIEHVLHVFNHAITSSVFPTMWKSVIVRPVVKVASPSDYYCVCFVEGFKRLINSQILAHVDRAGLFSEFQYGFGFDHSNTTALVRVIEVLRSCWTFRRRLIVWTIVYFCTSLSRRLIFMDRLGIYCPHF